MFAVCGVVRTMTVWVRGLQLSATPPSPDLLLVCATHNNHTYKTVSLFALPRLFGRVPLSWLLWRSLTREQVEKQCSHYVALYET